MPPQINSPLVQKLIAPIKASPKKAAFLGLLVLVLMGLWLRLVLSGHTTGAAQGAALRPRDIPIADSPAAPRPITERGMVFLQWVHQTIVPLHRNIFEVPFDYYPVEQAKGTADAGSTDSFWGMLAKSMSTHADQQGQRQVLIDNLQASARALKLDSTMLGATPSAMVNGEMVQEGGVVAGFRVLKIEARGMIVEREGIKLEILMK